MTDAYRFVSWSRHGLAAAVPSDPSGTVNGHAVLPVSLGVLRGDESTTTPVAVKLRLHGPGDVVGIDPRQVIRTDPPPLTTTFEPNYFPAIEFNLVDYPWIFSPEASGERLRPWIVLVVVRKEVAEVRNDPSRPLPCLLIDGGAAPDELPVLSESWAWAHVQLAGANALSSPHEVPSSRSLARLLCPRKLKPAQAYIACVVPAFAAGRQAGLGQEVKAGGEDAWPPFETSGASFELPVYHSWEFSTGPAGDFEALARRLQARFLGSEIGSRPMDLTTAGWGLTVPPSGEAGSALGLEGALMSLAAVPTDWPRAARTDFEDRLLELLTASVDGQTVLTPPLHGARAAPTVPAPPAPGTSAGWLWALNLDPRNRAAAGFGAQVVAEQQEQLVASAWDQAGDLTVANSLLRRAQVARAVAASVHEHRIAPLATDAPDVALRLTQPLHSRVRVDPHGGHDPGTASTLRGHLRASIFPESAVSPPFRRAVRPRGPIGRHLPAGGGEGSVAELTTKLAAGEVSVPLKKAKGAVRFDHVGTPKLVTVKNDVPDAAGWTHVHSAVPSTNPVYPSDQDASLPAARALAPSSSNGGPLPNGNDEDLPPNRRPVRQRRLANINTRFRLASDALFELIPEAAASPLTAAADDSVDLGGIAGTLASREGPLGPENTVPQEVAPLLPATVLVPTPAPGPQPADPLAPRSLVPTFPQPMSEPLRELAPDLILPGAEHIPPDTVGVLVGNARFIEAYMVGLNHAMSGEFLWRDLPTDYGATYFRQFWDTRGAGEGASTDIEPIAGWAPAKALGDNATRVGSFGMLVLLVRGELFRRYPDTIVSAVRADTLDSNQEDVRYPEFRGRLDPDITFLGFDLGLDEARGDDGGPGWYFVLQEQPTAPRFGLDAIPEEGGDDRFGGRPATWAAAHWGMLAATATEFHKLNHASATGRLNGHPALLFPADPPPAPPPPTATWGVSAAETAVVTFQQPARIAIYAAQLLSEAGPDPALRVTAVEREGDTIVALAGTDAAGQPWRMTHDEVVDVVGRGAQRLVVPAPNGRRRRIVVSRGAARYPRLGITSVEGVQPLDSSDAL